LPKVLGAVGGVSLLLGTTALFKLNLQRHPMHGDVKQKPMDLGFIALLFFTSLSGLGLWLGRGSIALPALLAIHLGCGDGFICHPAVRQICSRYF
jgi:citrate/tricarballylate utilization protein